MNNLTNLFHMVFPRGPKQSGDRDTSRMEQGRSRPSFTTPGGLGRERGHRHDTPELPHMHVDDDVDHSGRPNIAADDQLNLFRHLTGITSHPSMVHAHFDGGGRPAPNLGMYARIVRNEQTAKLGYKYFSWLINSCLGLQIVVAAALTAMGAAGASRSTVTVFGAINTVIAGVLTFLKGSGLPNRLKYYQSEWKRVREFIEQRERDFSRPGCDLDIYGVVAIVEHMYEEVKIDLEASTPDRFAGFGSSSRMGGPAAAAQIEAPTKTKGPNLPPLPRHASDALSAKFKEYEAGFGGKVKELASEIGYKASEARTTATQLQDREEHISEDAGRGVSEYAEKLETSFGGRIKDLAADIVHMAHREREVARDLQERGRRDVAEVATEGREVVDRAERAASGGVRISFSGEKAAKEGGEDREVR